MASNDKPIKPVELSSGIFWVGKRTDDEKLSCNPYLIIDGDEAILLDPGSPLDFEQVLQNVESLVSLKQIKAIIVHHQDPDLCASIPLFAKMGLDCPIVLHWRTATIVKYYGFPNPFRIVNETNWEYLFKSGRRLQFLPAPYCHFPGSIMTFDAVSGILFSGDVFGAMAHSPGLFANRDYLEPMKAFHEHYMPGREILAPIIERLQPLPLRIIAPQHGKIIKEDLSVFISTLKVLECGTYTGTVKTRTGDKTGKADIPAILNEILFRLSALFSEREVRDVFRDSTLVLKNEKVEIDDFTIETETLWNGFFDRIHKEKGIRWLTIIEPTVVSFVLKFELPLPDVFRTVLNSSQHYAALSKEATALAEGETDRILQIKMTQSDILNDSLTGLYNQRFLWSFLTGLVGEKERPSFSLIYCALDTLQDLNRIHGWQAGDEALRSAAYLIRNYSENHTGHLVCKLNTPAFAYLIENCEEAEGRKIAEGLRALIRDSDVFLEKTTASFGIFYSKEVDSANKSGKDLLNWIFKTTLARLRLAQEESNGTICDSIQFKNPEAILHKRILFVEPDRSYLDFIKPRLESRGFHIQDVHDGEAALETLKNWKPDVIIAEAMTPKLNGFELRERAMAQSGLYRVPFILISHRKDEDYIKRAARLGITIYLKKPFSYYELEGLVQNLTH